MKIAFSFNVKHTNPSKNITAQKEADYDSPEVIDSIKKALQSAGHSVLPVEADMQAYLQFYNHKKEIDIVFNIAEGLDSETREAQIPIILDLMKIPYTHSGSLTQVISLDKNLTKIVLEHNSILTPKYQLINNLNDDLNPNLTFPLMVKPNREGSSIGIFSENLVFDRLKLLERIKWTLQKLNQPVLVEEYIDGREFTVSILGNNNPQVLPIVEQNFAIFPENIPHIASYEAKWFFEDNLPNPHDAYFCPAPISADLTAKIEKICLKTYRALDCKDVARIDLRMNNRQDIYVLEVNTLPGLIGDPNIVSYLPIAARTAGFSFEGLVNTILNEAVKRYGINIPKKNYHGIKNYWPEKYLLAE